MSLKSTDGKGTRPTSTDEKRANAPTRKAINTQVEKALLAASGGYCQNPGCNSSLFEKFSSGEVALLKDLAHIIAHSPRGPRGDAPIAQDDVDGFDNIILLCPRCHRLVDSAPDEFPIDLLRRWKSDHEERIRKVFCLQACSSRDQLNDELQDLLIQNRAVFEEYGPTPERAGVVVTDAAAMWRRAALETIVPNNRKLVQLLTVNRRLLTPSERVVAEKFALHKDGFEYNQTSGQKNAAAPVFPKAEMFQLAGVDLDA